MSRPFAALVLAAGRGSRFGGGKMLARLDGRPLLQHVLDTVAQAEPAQTVVVLGGDSLAVEAAIHWRSERRIVNPHPEHGLASSLRLGVGAIGAEESAAGVDSILICLGDQPRLRASVIRALAEAETDRPIVAPRYRNDGSRNPVLVQRAAWPRALAATGDEGLGAFIRGNPELVLELAFDGGNPDVDTLRDLEGV